MATIFAIKPDEYRNIIAEEDAEFELFKVILTFNEKLAIFQHPQGDKLKFDELLFLHYYLLNDTNNYDFKSIMQAQTYYAYNFIKSCEEFDVLQNSKDMLFQKWGISSWRQYFGTLLYVANEVEQFRKKQLGGVFILKPEEIKKIDETGLISVSLIEKLSINEEEYIPFYDVDTESPELNVDYRAFRASPFIRLKGNKGYLITNIELVCERLYNSLYFDFMPFINVKNGSVGKFDFNKEFVEKKLFRNTVRKCLSSSCFTFPQVDSEKEVVGEPDFYYRHKEKIVIFECKAIKINGEIRDEGDGFRLFDDLREKIVRKNKELGSKGKLYAKKSKPKGIGQLIHHIVSIDEDTFAFDKDIPDEVTYYPILIFEDVRLLQPGLLSILNRWFVEEMSQLDEAQQILQGCMPVMALSINTLYLYDDLIKRRGLTNLIDIFVAKNSTIDENGNYIIYENSCFDSYLHLYRFYKNNEIGKWLVNRI